ncbi:GNAT family N-acetyltransferase [Proteus mirabilis]|uniref:GNAT family N-acetyltransferase n=1 Tax=Proteus mirabilis TaxID=584 RepID=UPI0034E451C7
MIIKLKKHILTKRIIKKLKERNNLVIEVSEYEYIIEFTANYYNEQIGYGKILIKDKENMILSCLKIEVEYQNLGIGSTLLKEIIIYCKKNGIKEISGIIKGNIEKLNNFYISHGFSIIDGKISMTL